MYDYDEEALRREITLWIIIAVSLLLFISNLGFGGFVGKFVSGILFGIFGLVAYVFPILLLVGSFFAISNRGNSFAILKIVAASVFAIFICLFKHRRRGVFVRYADPAASRAD